MACDLVAAGLSSVTTLKAILSRRVPNIFCIAVSRRALKEYAVGKLTSKQSKLFI